MMIAIGSDHAGYEGDAPYKPEIMRCVATLGHQTLDCGTYDTKSVDYPDFADAVCGAILEGRAESGILLCGTGIGMCIAANRNRGIRAATCVTPEMARLAREHNDANVLCLGRRVLPVDECEAIIRIWLTTPFSGGERHCRRIRKLG